jgi:hypothetical protein
MSRTHHQKDMVELLQNAPALQIEGPKKAKTAKEQKIA